MKWLLYSKGGTKCMVPSTLFPTPGQQILFVLRARCGMDPLRPCSLTQSCSDLAGALVPPETWCHCLLTPGVGEPQLIHCEEMLRGLFLFSDVVVPSAEFICLFVVIPPLLGHDRQEQSHEVSFFINFYSFLEVLRNLWPVIALKAGRGHTAVLPRKQSGRL